ncbi:MAG: YiiX/YebB-like N1pC/P60 family cysteine hydrolase [Bacteriovorax sp.]|nr:YiiX/YebB-like N1pC/P60 family cysteine hydrolase [Bacteriovorax sp.]
MKKINIFIFLIFLTSCSHTGGGPRVPANEENSPLATEKISIDEHTDEINNLRKLIEDALKWRLKALGFYEDNIEKFNKLNFSHKDLLDLYASTKEYMIMRDQLLIFVKKYQANFSTIKSIKLRPDSGTDLDGVTEKIDPKDSEGKELLLKMKISFSAALVLYDNYLMGIYPYVGHRKTRKLINKDIPDLHNSLEKITDNFFDVKQRFLMFKIQEILQADFKFEKDQKVSLTDDEKYLDEFITKSPFYNFLEKKHIDLKNQNAVTAYLNRILDRFTFLNESFTFIASKTFGNTLGLVAFRKGYLTKLSSEEKEGITSRLKPLDIFLEKTPFRLTDQFIPGYYGHVAIWLGTEEELKELGIWDDPMVQKYHEAIQSGHHIVEALRPGVQINTFDHFLNIDDFLVLRDKNLSDDQRREFILRSLAQIGKEYDFNFDVETDSQIVCSEIVYVVFHDINWPTKKALGRYTISPDNVANKALDGTLAPILMYRSGKQVNENLLDNLKSELGAK